MERHLRGLGDGAAQQPERDEHRQRRSVAERPGAAAKTVEKSSDPVCWTRMKSARTNVASPTAFMTNAFLPARPEPGAGASS